MRKAAMLQSNYIPWKGVFDLIHRADVFVFYDDVQFTVKDWRSRNKIPTANGELWLTVPVLTKGRREQLVSEATIDCSADWQQKHHRTLSLVYSKAPFRAEYEQLLFDFYLARRWVNLSEMNMYMTRYICSLLGIEREFRRADEFKASGGKDGEKVINICRQLGCDSFINGPAAKAFMDEQKFKEAGIELCYMTYDYPEYRQLYRPFNHNVSVLDLLFMTGKDAPDYIWGGKGGKG